MFLYTFFFSHHMVRKKMKAVCSKLMSESMSEYEKNPYFLLNSSGFYEKLYWCE